MLFSKTIIELNRPVWAARCGRAEWDRRALGAARAGSPYIVAALLMISIGPHPSVLAQKTSKRNRTVAPQKGLSKPAPPPVIAGLVDVKAFGAKANGKDIDSDAINKAIEITAA
ncbi:MAG TPA: hypothetical protein VFV34_01465, partial [Blastocatellia bacterium]|nr:hypothetical protein [Blastocatellia bacterium]